MDSHCRYFASNCGNWIKSSLEMCRRSHRSSGRPGAQQSPRLTSEVVIYFEKHAKSSPARELAVGRTGTEKTPDEVGDFHLNRRYDSLKVVRKGGKKGSLAIHPQTAQRIRDYVAKVETESDTDAPLFLPVRGNQRSTDERRHLQPGEIDRILRKYARRLGLERGYSAHSMRATFITTALDNGASLEDVQRAAGHDDPSTTKLYDRRGYHPEKSASFFASY
jgi:integrase/recombinase XerD